MPGRLTPWSSPSGHDIHRSPQSRNIERWFLQTRQIRTRQSFAVHSEWRWLVSLYSPCCKSFRFNIEGSFHRVVFRQCRVKLSRTLDWSTPHSPLAPCWTTGQAWTSREQSSSFDGVESVIISSSKAPLLDISERRTRADTARHLSQKLPVRFKYFLNPLMAKCQPPRSRLTGGPTYCALASLHLAPSQSSNSLSLTSEERKKTVFWLLHKQSSPDGGFCGRTEKPADACYSFWCSASLRVRTSGFLSNYSITSNSDAQYMR